MGVTGEGSRRWFAAYLACCVTGLAGVGVIGLVGSPALASAETSRVSLGEGIGASASSLAGSLVISGSPTQGEQMLAGRQAMLASPAMVAAREASRTKFEHLDTGQAARVAGEAFPGVIDRPAGGPPQLPAGQKITGYVTDNAAQLELPGGKHAVIESLEPIATQTASGHRVPIDLGLHANGGSFQPATAIVGVSIPKRLSDGVSLAGSGVSLTPVDAQGAVLGGSEGAVDGAGVLYANTQTDMDSLIKPTTDGFEADTVLRSVDSPDELYFRVGLPAGARLVHGAKDGSGVVDVIKGGATIATVLPPGAQDAAGTAVPVSMTVSGDTLALSVADHAAEYQYPIEVDPEVLGTDVQLTASGSKRSNWEFYALNGKKEVSKNFEKSEEGGILKTYGVHEYKEGELAFWVYQTRGVSKIYQFKGETEASNKEDHIESVVELQYGEVKTEHGITEGEGEHKAQRRLSTEAEGTSEYKQTEFHPALCPSGTESCPESAGHSENAVHFQQSVVNKPTSKYSFSDELDKGTVYISEPSGTHSTASENTTTPEFSQKELEEASKGAVKGPRKNALYGSSNWLSEYDGAIQFIAKDTGIGVAKSWLEYENSGKWEAVTGSVHEYLATENLCKGVQCAPEQKELWTLNPHLPNGEDKIRYRAEEAFGQETHQTESLESEAVGTVKVNTSKPYNIYLGGLPYGNELSEKSYKFTAYATDGEGSTIPSSGIESLTVFIENSKGEKKSIAKTGGTGECEAEKGACQASAEYAINGAELGAGHHGIVIEAKDRAGNEGREEEQVSIRHSTPVPMGPGSVDLQSGDFTLAPTDVSLGSGLTVSRVYSSRDLTAGVTEGSPLGPQWSLSLGSEESLVELVNGSLLVTSGNGGQTIFAAVLNSEGKPTGKFEAPPGDSNLTMTLEENEKKEKVAYYLKDPAAGTTTKFTPSSASKVWVPTVQEGPVSMDTVSYIYETTEVSGKKVTRPSEERGATTAKVSCSPTIELGCRVLKFKYAATTTAKGENKSEWGEYIGRLSKIYYEGYDPALKRMTEGSEPVAEYSYDKQGRLRAESGRSTALKTTYGYDAEGHVTALTPPGLESWVFTYGTLASDAGTGRLIKVAQAPASAGLWNGELSVNTEAPKVASATPIEGVAISVSHGTWSNSPVAYSFQWEDCKIYKTPEEEEEERIYKEERKGTLKCTPIPGANNSSYEPVLTDIGYKLIVKVSALNGGGAVAVATAATAEVEAATEYSVPGKQPYDITAGPDKNIWFTDTKGIGKSTPSGSITEYAVSKSHGITAGPDGNLWFTKVEPAAIGKITTSGAITEYSLPTGSYPVGITTGPDKNLWFTDWDTAKVGKITTSGTITEYSLPAGSYPGGIVTGPDENLWFTIYREHEDKIGKITTSGVITEYSVPSTLGQPSQITVGPDGNLWFTADGIGKITTAGIVTAYSLPEKVAAYSIVAGSDGNLWYTAGASGTKLGRITPSGVITEALLPTGEETYSLATGPEGDLWDTNYDGNEIGKIVPVPAEGDPSPQPGTTIEYNVPVSGSGAPHEMSAKEVAKWGQKAEEAPAEATAILPPDSPQGWPASSYTRATVFYLDGEGRLVNTATPSTGKYGSISTTEYNEYNDVVRTLSPDNRATALAAGTKSEEVANLLSTISVYNEQRQCRKESGNPEKEVAEPGTRLCETWGPEHEVKYTPNGFTGQKESLARSHTKYYYEDKANGAPEEIEGKKQAYDLVTETKELAQLFYASEGKEKEGEEVEERASTTSYSGQGGQEKNLGWKLREPTLVTEATESGGADVKHATLYNESGQVVETRGPTTKDQSGESPADEKTVYYSEEENKEESGKYKECGLHSEWAGLVCETLPAKQPETTGVPNLPVTTTTYNVWDEPETIVETFPKSSGFAEHTRTTKEEYDNAGQLLFSEETSTASTEATDKALPVVQEAYNTKTGLLEKQSTTVGEKTETITSKYNTLGQLETYTDADGNVAKFKYGGPEKDGLLEEMTEYSNEGANPSQKYTYNSTTKQLEKLVDSAAGTFTASYDTEGNMTSEIYPNGMCANYTDNSVGEATHIEYTKTSTCSGTEGVWFSETKIPSVRGETMSRTSTLASENYTYDTLGRLTQVQETPAGEYCKTRVYEYGEESNRKKLTKYEPNSKKECATEGGTEEKHAYDEANRLTDSGITYDPLGNVTKLPAGDAEGHALESTFYVDNAVATQTQNGVTNDYFMDPSGRVRETISGAKKTISHYDGPGEAVAWTCEGAEKAETCESTAKWTRNIPGIDGTLSAVQNGTGATGETPILQIHDLQGDVAATIKDKTGETKLESTYNSTEFGAPNGGKEPPKFAWLGAGGVEKSLASGVITEGATSYVPQTGKALQSEEVAPPGLPDGSGGQAATFTASPWNLQGAERVGAEAPGKEAGREREAWVAACEANLAQCVGAGGVSEIDPRGCVGVGGLGEENSMLGRDSLPYLNVTCHSPARVGASLEICIVDKGQLGYLSISKGAWKCGKWTELKKGYDNGKKFALAVYGFGECESESRYVIAFGYLIVPMKAPQWNYGKEETCHPDGGENEKRAFGESNPGVGDGD